MRLVDYVIAEAEHRWKNGESARWELQLDAIIECERQSPLAGLFLMWHQAAPEHGAPTTDRFDPVTAIKKITWNEGTRCGVVRFQGRAGDSGLCRDPGNLPMGAALTNEKERQFLEFELQSVALNLAARYHQIDQEIDGNRSWYSRVLLPVVDGHDTVLVLVAENHTIDAVVARSGS